MKGTYTYLTDIPIFNSLTEKETELIYRSACRKTFHANCMIMMEGQPISIFAVLTRGRAKAVLLREDGGEILLHFYKPGDFFGEMNVSEITDCPYSIFSVKKSEFIFISIETMIRLIKQNGDFAFALFSFVSNRLYSTQNRLRDYIYERGEGKILKYFHNIASQIGVKKDGGIRIPEKLSHQVIANTCGLTRETVTRLLRQLQKKSLLSQTKEGWFIAKE